uniref:Uncharacterized protein n=1 Tax=Fagus sylvatica TaxID=28930 RepID=A0A2N9HPZ0_FAGSY
MDDDDIFIFEIHFGGRFKNLNGLVYVNGDVTVHDEPFDSDCLSIFELESILGKYGYQRGDLIYYKLTDMSLDNGLVLLKTDNDVLNMVDVHKTEKFVVLYTVSAADADDCIPLTPTLPEVLVVDKSKGKGKETGTSNKRDKLPIIDRSKGIGKEKMFEVSVEKEYDADDDVDCGDFDNDNEAGLEVEDEDSEMDLWDGLLSGDEDLLDTAIAAYSQGMASQPATTTNEERGPKPKSVEFDVVDMSNPVLENGMKFADVYQFREAVREYNLKIGKDLSFVKNDKDKGHIKEHLLSAVSRDANDNMYPICVVVVESECKASWSWFLSILLKDIGEVTDGWTFISDRQKGLTESFKEVCPDMDHRACVRHIYANFRDSGHRGKALKDKLWAAASAYTEFEFDAYMVELKKLSPPAYEYLSKIPVATWSRSKFTKNPKSDLIVNNLSECFNSYILDARDKPILTMLDTIRRKLMRRFQVKKASIARMSGKLCPKIQWPSCCMWETESTGGATGSAGATETGSAARGGASRKAKVVVVPTVEKVMTRIATKKQKKQ